MALLLLAGCSPALHPLYRDYKVEPHTDALDIRIQNAMTASGWTLAANPAPNVIVTDERAIRDWGLYKTVVYLEAVEIGEEYMRLLVHPYRQYVWNARSKITFLNGAIRRDVLQELDEAMSVQNMIAVGNGVLRNREGTR